MPRVLVIDDDPGILKLVDRTLGSRGYEVYTAANGIEGLNRVQATKPDIVILDKVMPDIDGFEVARRLRREPDFAHIPIVILTGASQLGDKLDAFNAGADDYLTKPFEVDELAARLAALLRRAEAFKAAQSQSLDSVDTARLIAVHSLRGGVGCSSLALNLAYSLTNLWRTPTLLMDMVLPSGQVALMLNEAIKRSWSDLTAFDNATFDIDALEGILNQHRSGLHFIAAPKDPIDAEEVSSDLLKRATALLKPRYEYMVADLPHDFSDVSLDTLEAADVILLILAPELVSIRAASVTLNTYGELGFEKEKIRLILNKTIAVSSLNAKQIEEALHHPISLVLPHAPKRFVGAINRGVPMLESDPTDTVSAQIEDFAFRLSKEAHQLIPPPAPGEAWHRVNKRLQLFDSSADSNRRGLFGFGRR
ncbi:MAG: response regulator [Chloroflexota bacterium]